MVCVFPHQTVLDPIEYILPAEEHLFFGDRCPRYIGIDQFVDHDLSAMLSIALFGTNTCFSLLYKLKR